MRETTHSTSDRALRNGRARTLVLALLGALLVLHGAPRQPEADGEVAATERPRSELQSAHIEGVLRNWNPNLDGHTVARIASAVGRYSQQYELEADLVTAVIIVESSVRPWAHSPKGAIGLMQVMPHMIYPLGLAGNPTTIESNIEAGCWILSNNIRRLGEERGISAYFWGSRIRNLAYLEKVQEARENIRRRTS